MDWNLLFKPLLNMCSSTSVCFFFVGMILWQIIGNISGLFGKHKIFSKRLFESLFFSPPLLLILLPLTSLVFPFSSLESFDISLSKPYLLYPPAHPADFSLPSVAPQFFIVNLTLSLLPFIDGFQGTIRSQKQASQPPPDYMLGQKKRLTVSYKYW